MAPASFGPSLRYFLRRLGPRSVDDQSDLALLARFATERDELAFAALVARHGPMVLGVCRRVLRDRHDADDVFQATFLVLASKATALDGRRPLASWLYTVARNLALKLRARVAQRRSHEKEATTMPAIEPCDETAWREVRHVLDAELGQLPEKYRAPLVLCHLEGLTHEAAARELGWPAGSIAKRLARGQQLLRSRLAGRGLTLSSVALAALLLENGTVALAGSVPLALGRAAVLYVAGKTSAGLASAAAVALAEGAPTMSLAKTKIAAGLLLGLTLLGGVGAGAVALRAGPAPVPPASAAPAVALAEPSRAAREKEDAERLVRKKLESRVTLDKGFAPNTQLEDALEFLSDRYDLATWFDQKAFADGGVPKVLEHAVRLPRMSGIRLSVVIRLLLGQIELENGMVGGYRINGNVLEIVPLEPSEPDEHALSRKVRQRLLRPMRWLQGEARLAKDGAYAISFAETLDMIRVRYGEKVTVDKASFAAFDFPPLTDLVVPARGLAGDLCLSEVLDYLHECHEGTHYVIRYRIKPDTIELCAVKRDSPQAVALEQDLEPVRGYQVTKIVSAELDRKLDQSVTIEKGAQSARLAEVLELLSDMYDVTILIDSQAFAAAGIEKVEEFDVRLPAVNDIKRSALLQKVLDQVQKGDWTAQFTTGVGLVGPDSVWRRQDYLEIGPLHKHVKDQKPLTEEQWTSFWDDLAQGKSGRVLLALDTLCRYPEQSVLRLRERLKPVAAPDPKKLTEAARWIPGLDSDQFAARQKAAAELEKLGSAALEPLKRGLRDRPRWSCAAGSSSSCRSWSSHPPASSSARSGAFTSSKRSALPKPRRSWSRWPGATPAPCRPRRPGQRWDGCGSDPGDQASNSWIGARSSSRGVGRPL
jgi:RNA polymerase sigma factor (sigma-70 family)